MSTSELSDIERPTDEDENDPYKNELNGLLVTYEDDRIDENIRLALKRKSRVRYKCFDIFLSFIAFGTSSGAIYLFKLESINHSSCELLLMIPCDQGSIEIIKFLPNPQSDDLSIVIGTTRGSIVVFKLAQSAEDQGLSYSEVYCAPSFTSNSSIKLIESDNDMLDPTNSFSKLYICDSANRLYTLESRTIYTSKQALRLFNYNSQLPTLIFSISDSNINQICVYRSQVLVSTNETTRVFNEFTNQLQVIGKKKRKEGFYGACFFNPNYRPIRIVQIDQTSNRKQPSLYSSRSSVNELENVIIFVARPVFRLWQVNYNLAVLFTHQFEPLIKSFKYDKLLELQNRALNKEDIEDPSTLMNQFAGPNLLIDKDRLKCNHFCKLIQIYSSTLGNLILSYSQHEIFVVDPIGARLIACHHQEDQILQISCHENELYVWSLRIVDEQQTFKLRRILLLAPTQFVLELHRTHRYLTLMSFVQFFSDLFRHKMALPLTGVSTITTEGGLLRNILLNAWDVHNSVRDFSDDDECNQEYHQKFEEFHNIVESIIDESKMLKHSFENINDSRFFLTMTNENIDRLCAEPYASLVSLDVSIKDLHTNHVIHFNQDALSNRYRSVANLSESIRGNVIKAKLETRSSFDLRIGPTTQIDDASTNERDTIEAAKVVVERRFPKRSKQPPESARLGSVMEIPNDHEESEAPGSQVRDMPIEHANHELDKPDDCPIVAPIENDDQNDTKVELLRRCPQCKWPTQGSHHLPMDDSQKEQFEWLQEHLLGNFEENIVEITDLAFSNALWLLFLRCLAFQKRLDDYVTCCILLDDIRILEIERFVITRGDEAEVIDCLLRHLDSKLENEVGQRKSIDDCVRKRCLKCRSDIDVSAKVYDEISHEETQNFGFTLSNLLEHCVIKRQSSMKRMVSHLLKYPTLLNSSEIPISFYLKAIEIVSRRSARMPASNRMNQILPDHSTF